MPGGCQSLSESTGRWAGNAPLEAAYPDSARSRKQANELSQSEKDSTYLRRPSF